MSLSPQSGFPQIEQPPQLQPHELLIKQVNESGIRYKVAICVPTTTLIDVRWALAWPGVCGTFPGGSQLFADWRYGVAETREQLWYTAWKGIPDLTHIMWIDSDVILDLNCIPQLLLDNKPIVSGIYFNSLLTGVNAWLDEKPIDIRDQKYKEQPLVQVDKVGMGVCLMQKSVFDELQDEEKPLFYYKVDVTTQSLLSEDFYFFQKLAKHGIKPWVDLRCRATHLKATALTPEGLVIGPAPPQSQPPTPTPTKS